MVTKYKFNSIELESIKIATILSVHLCPYHLVRTTLSVPFGPYHFVQYHLVCTTLSVPFCPIPFCPVTLKSGITTISAKESMLNLSEALTSLANLAGNKWDLNYYCRQFRLLTKCDHSHADDLNSTSKENWQQQTSTWWTEHIILHQHPTKVIAVLESKRTVHVKYALSGTQ